MTALPDADSSRAGAVVALKPVARAKSRLAGLPDPLRRRLAWTMAVDTLTALASGGAELLVVSDQPALASRLARAGVPARVVGESGAVGMNGALARGARLLAAAGCSTVLACVGDLPALRPASVQAVLQAAPKSGRAFVADASGTGTTMLLARGTELDPRFQGPSAAAHTASGAAPLTDDQLGTAVPDARSDVDTEDDLGAAVELGLGVATARLVDTRGQLGHYAVITTTGHTDDQDHPLAITSAGYRMRLPPDALADGLRTLRPGQRLHSVLTDDVVLSAWL